MILTSNLYLQWDSTSVSDGSTTVPDYHGLTSNSIFFLNPFQIRLVGKSFWGIDQYLVGIRSEIDNNQFMFNSDKNSFVLKIFNKMFDLYRVTATIKSNLTDYITTQKTTIS